MGSIITFILALVIGSLCIYAFEKDVTIKTRFCKIKTDSLFFVLIGILCLIYGTSGFLLYLGKNNHEYEYAKYLRAKCEAEFLKTDATVNIETVKLFKEDIDFVNDNIELSRKHCDNWYLKSYYYKEIAQLEKLNYDTINVKIK